MQNYSLNKIPAVAAGAALLGLASIANAQELFGATNDYTSASGYDLKDGAAAESDRFEYLKLGARQNVTFDDNIGLDDTDEVDDVIFTTDLILSLKNRALAENSWELTYIPSFKFYADNSDYDGVDHNVNVGFTKMLAKTSVELGADFASISGADRYVAGQVDKDVYGAHGVISHVLTGKTRADLSVNYEAQEFSSANYVDRDTFNARLAGFYQVSPKVNVGPYVGYQNVDVAGANPDHEAISGGVAFEYEALAKTSFNGFFGGENRSFSGSALDDATSLVYNIGSRYHYSAKTLFDFSVYRSTAPSYSAAGGGSFDSTGARVAVSYQASDKLAFRSNVNYEQDHYSGGAPGQDNDYFSLTLGGSYKLPSGLELGAEVTFREKDADTSAYDFDNTLLKLNATYYF